MRGCRCPASFRLSAGRATAGEPGAAPVAGGATPAESDGGASGRPESRRGGRPPPFVPRLGRPRNVRPFTSSHPEAEESRVQPPGAGVRPPRAESGKPGPACRHFLSENGALRWGRRRRRSGRASSRLGSCCLPVRWGERWSFPWWGGEWPRRGRRRVHASGHVWAATWSRSQGPPRGVDVPGEPAEVSGLGL